MFSTVLQSADIDQGSMRNKYQNYYCFQLQLQSYSSLLMVQQVMILVFLFLIKEDLKQKIE